MAKKRPAAPTIWMPEQLEFVSLLKLKPFDRNPNEHSDEQVDAIARGMEKFGWPFPIVIDDHNVIVSGHGRVLAAAKLKLPHAPVIRVGHLSANDRMALMVADNKLARMGTWNPEKLQGIMVDLSADGYDMAATAFSDEELQRLIDDTSKAALGAMAGDGEGEGGDGEGDGRRDGGSGREKDGDGTEMLPFTVLLEAEQRDEVYAAIRKAKARDGLTMTGDALMLIVKEWTDDQAG